MNNYFYAICLYIVVILYTTPAHTQSNNIDSLKTILLSQEEDTNRVNNLIELSKEYFLLGELGNSLHYGQSALSLSVKINYKLGIGFAFSRIGYAESHLNNYAEALKSHYSALKVFEELGHKHGVATSLQLLGSIHYSQGNDAEALNYYFSCLKVRQEINEIFGVAQTNNSIGQIYAKQGRLNEALEMYFESLKIFEKPGGPDWGTAYTLREIARIYEQQGIIAEKAGNNDLAISKFLEAQEKDLTTLKIWEDLERNAGIAESFVDLGNINVKLRRFGQAEDYLKKGLTLSTTINFIPIMRDAYRSLEVMDSTMGHYENAYRNYKKYVLYRDSLVNEESTRKSSQAKMQYEFDKNETIAKAEQARIALRNKYWILGLFTGSAVLFLITVILWRNNKAKQISKLEILKAYQELKTTQAQLIQSEKMASLGELTAGIAHEIQNPLNFVNNFSEVNTELIGELKEELAMGNWQQAKEVAENIKENEEKINHHGRRADAIVKGMLQHSRNRSGVKEPTDINALADEYLRLAYHGLRAKDKSFNAKMLTDFDQSIGLINVIPQDIGRVILNLITNAFYAVSHPLPPKGGPDYEPIISVSTKKAIPPLGGRGTEGSTVEIRIKDNGPGISPNVIDKIFQPFFTTKPTGQGTGLGLSLSYDIVKAHGGDLKVETKEGEGTTFILQLPTS